MDNCICDLNDDHLLNNPKVLPCGFSACLMCLKETIDEHGNLNCKCCKQTHVIQDADKLISNVKIANMIKNNLHTFTAQLLDKLQLNLNRLHATNQNSELLCNKYFDFLKEDILLKIESLKIELDKLSRELLQVLDDKCLKVKLKLEQFSAQVVQNNLKNTQIFINNVKSSLSNHTSPESIHQENMYLCQDNCKKIESHENEINRLINSVEFKPSEVSIQQSLVGQLIDLVTEKEDLSETNLLATKISMNNSDLTQDVEIIDLNKKMEWPCGMCYLSKSEIAITDNVNNEIIVLNTLTHDILKQIKSIGDVKLTSPFGICYDEKDSIYLCDGANHRLLIINKLFNKIKKIIGKKGTLPSEFNFPLGVCYYNGFVYVSDHDNKRVQILTHNGDFIREIKLVKHIGKKNNIFIKEQDLINSPWCLSITHDTIAVLDFCENVYIYNFDGQLRHVIQDNTINSVCIIDEYLFTHSNNGLFCCYEKNKKNKYDNHLYELVNKRIIDNFKAYSAFIIFHGEKLIISFGEKKFLGIVNPKKLLN